MRFFVKKLVSFIFYRGTFLYLKYLEPIINFSVKSYYSEKYLNRFLSVGSNVKINGKITVLSPKSLVVGNNVHIGADCFFHCGGGISIGDNSHLSRRITIYSANHEYEGVRLPYDESYNMKPVVIGRNVWIGMNANIAPGVNIGDGAIIGMGSIVTKDVPPMGIVGSAGQRILKSRNQDSYLKLDEEKKYGGVSGFEYDCLNDLQSIENKKQIFILSTGRSGSQSIAKVLATNPNVVARHEPFEFMIKMSTDFLHGVVSGDKIERILSAFYRSAKLTEEQLVYVESDQKLVPITHLLNKILPKSKFLWLIRNPYEVVRSTYYRGWFSNKELEYPVVDEEPEVYASNIYVANRPIGYICNQMTEEEWKSMSPFERNCWYWRYWNEMIENQLKKIDRDRWEVYDLSQLDKRTKEISKFIGGDFKYNFIKSNQSTYEKKDYKDWTSDQKNFLEKWCVSYYNELSNKYDLV